MRQFIIDTIFLLWIESFTLFFFIQQYRDFFFQTHTHSKKRLNNTNVYLFSRTMTWKMLKCTSNAFKCNEMIKSDYYNLCLIIRSRTTHKFYTIFFSLFLQILFGFSSSSYFLLYFHRNNELNDNLVDSIFFFSFPFFHTDVIFWCVFVVWFDKSNKMVKGTVTLNREKLLLLNILFMEYIICFS